MSTSRGLAPGLFHAECYNGLSYSMDIEKALNTEKRNFNYTTSKELMAFGDYTRTFFSESAREKFVDMLTHDLFGLPVLLCSFLLGASLWMILGQRVKGCRCRKRPGVGQALIFLDSWVGANSRREAFTNWLT